MNVKKAEWLFGIIFSVVGLIFFIAGIAMTSYDTNFKKDALETTAVISSIETYRDSDGDTSHKVYVKYTVDGKEYEERLNYYSSGMRMGNEIQIYYKPEQPNRILGKSEFSFPGLIFSLMGFICAAIGLVFIFNKVMKIKNRKYLMENGELVYAEITEVNYNRSYSVNGRNPYTITCKWVDPSTGMYYFFKSETIWFDPEPIIRERDIKTLPVYIDRYNPKKYAVSCEELESMVAVV